MLTKIDVDGENAFYIPILGVTPKEPILIRKITGLNPPDIDLYIGDYARDGGFYQGRRVGKRNPVITFDLNPNPALGQTVSGLRELLYKAFLVPRAGSEMVRINLYDDLGRVRYLTGYTEKFEGEIFDQDPTPSISIICPDPYIWDSTPVDIKIPNYLVNSDVGWITMQPFVYGGTADAGFEIEIRITNTTPTLTLDLNGRQMVISDPNLTDTQVVYINTIRGTRDIQRTDASNIDSTFGAMTITDRWIALKEQGLTHPVFAGLSPSSPWLELHPQTNIMKVYGISSADTPANIRELQYTQAYWGV